MSTAIINAPGEPTSVAYANGNLLEEDDALLVVNAVRIPFNYLVKKLE